MGPDEGLKNPRLDRLRQPGELAEVRAHPIPGFAVTIETARAKARAEDGLGSLSLDLEKVADALGRIMGTAATVAVTFGARLKDYELRKNFDVQHMKHGRTGVADAMYIRRLRSPDEAYRSFPGR